MSVNRSVFPFLILSICYFIYLSFDQGMTIGAYIVIVILSQTIAIRSSSLNFDSPLLWYSSAVFIYHFSSLIISYFGFYSFNNQHDCIMIYGLIYYSGVFPLFFISYNRNFSSVFEEISNNFDKRVLIFSFIFFSILVVLINIYFLKSGVTGKADAILSGITKFNFVYNWFSLISIVTLVLFRDSRLFKYILLLSFLLCLLTSLNTGERNVILSFVLTLIIVNLAMGKIQKKQALLFVFIAAICIPILQELKAVFVKDSLDLNESFQRIPFIVKLLQGEFMSASRNLDWILSRSDSYEYFYGVNLIKDFLIGISPISTGLQNTQSWFNNTFFPEVVATGQGYGFSIYGSFYVSFGIFGLVLMSLCYSSIIVFVFNNRVKNYILFLLSILIITPTIYSQRGDISVLLSFIIKQNLIPLFLIYLPSLIMKGKIVVK
ncbi:O-antigen polysaccharide polymerase Wzy [Vibrio breoganii]